MSKVRGWQIAAALVVVISAGAAWYFTRGVDVDAAAMLAYFPEREATVAYLDVKELRTSGLLEKIAGSTVGEEPEYKTFVEKTGFDYKRDLDRVMLNSADGTHYFVLQGRFDWDKLTAYARGEGGVCRGEECSVRGSTPERIVSFRPLSKNLMAMATARDDAGSRRVERGASRPAAFPIPVEPLWVQLPASALQSPSKLPSGTRPFLIAMQKAERVLFSLGPGQDAFALKMDVVCKTAEEAAVLRTHFETLTQFVQKLISRENQKPNPQDLSGILTSGAFVREDRHVVGKWSIPQAFLASLSGGS